METSKKDIFLSIVHSRKSNREFSKDKEVTKEALETILKAAMAAPTAVSYEPWEFIAITERKVLDALGDFLPYSKSLLTATAAIAVCANPAVSEPYWDADCAAASENILLTVEALELGAVWTAVHPHEERFAEVRKILGLPENIIPFNVIAIGYPNGPEQPTDRFKKEKVHWNKW